jgi:hypothetical protein
MDDSAQRPRESPPAPGGDVPYDVSRRTDQDQGTLRRVRLRKPRKAVPSQASQDARSTLWLIGILVGVVLAGVGVWFLMSAWARAPFRGEMASYLAPPNPAAKPADADNGPRKLVVVDLDARDLDPLHFSLPNNLRAAGPNEVGRIVQLRWIQTTVGRYTSGGTAYKWRCEFTVIDKATRAVLQSAVIEGSEPPASIYGRRGQSESGSKPTQQVLWRLENMAPN